jgi:hypothetical protein
MPFHVVADLQRLYEENPIAFSSFASWIAQPSHTQAVTLRFHGGRFQCAMLEITSK